MNKNMIPAIIGTVLGAGIVEGVNYLVMKWQHDKIDELQKRVLAQEVTIGTQEMMIYAQKCILEKQ